jgi:hypothetical protein
MSSPFKMAPKTPFMKALVGKQGNLPQHLKDKILDAPETPAKSYGDKDAAMKSYGKSPAKMKGVKALKK